MANVLDVTKIPQITNYLQQKIERNEAWKETACKVMQCSGMALVVAGGATAVFYASPVIPFALVILIPIVFFIAMALSVTGGGAAPAAGPATSLGGDLITAFLKISVYAGIKWAEIIYTTKVAIVAGLANAAVAAVALPTLSGGGIVYLVKNNEVKHLKVLQDHLEKYSKDNNYQIPENEKKKLIEIGNYI